MRMLGKLPARRDPRTLKLEKYLTGEAPHIPAARDWTRDTTPDTDPLGNTTYGDCAYADIGHLITLLFALQGKPSPVTTAGILSAYSAGTGFDPAKPDTDNGASMLDVANQFRQDGICGVKCEAFVKVEPQNLALAIELFGAVTIGFRLPNSAMSQDIWDVVPNDGGEAGGHAVCVAAQSPLLLPCISWGERHPITYPFLGRYYDEIYAYLVPDLLVPNGLDLAALRADLALVTG